MQMSQMFCELPFRGGRDVLHKQNFPFISQSIEGIEDVSSIQPCRTGFSVQHPGQTSVTDNTGEALIEDY